MKIHVVSFQVPYPADYGGAIDVFYKLKAMREEGFDITLHTFIYGDRSEQPVLEEICSKVFYYPRETGWRKQFSLLPYIVNSRNYPDLLKNLCADEAPILFDGVHCCYLLTHPALAKRKKIVRMHNVEHEYYRQLARQAGCSWKALFYLVESWRLKRFEKRLNQADLVCAITKADKQKFDHIAVGTKVIHLPVFFDTTPLDTLTNDAPSSSVSYVLYQGNLAVEENMCIANFIVKEIAPRCPGVLFIIAGRRAKLAEVPVNVKVVSDPSDEELDRLIVDAHIHLLLTFQPTGIKLKLLNALTKGRGHIIANHDMLYGHSLGRFCVRADKPEEISDNIKYLINNTIDKEELQRRQAYLQKIKKAGISRLSLFQIGISF